MRTWIIRSVVASVFVIIAACSANSQWDSSEQKQPLMLEKEIVAAPVPEVNVEQEDVKPTDRKELFQKAIELYDQKKFAQSAEYFKELGSEFTIARALGARSLMESGKFQEAYSEAIAAVSDDPKSSDAHFILGLVAAKNGRLDEAAEAYRKVLDLDPEEGAAMNNLGSIHYQQKQFYQATYETQRAIEHSPDAEGKSISLSNLAELRMIDGDLRGAEESATQALDHSPESPQAYYELAVLYDILGRSDAALSMMRQALELDEAEQAQFYMEFVFPELKLQFDALKAESRHETAAAKQMWFALSLIESKGRLQATALEGVAKRHLEILSTIEPD